jgi:threonine/homoserine/homoserine lactone efflux protein
MSLFISAIVLGIAFCAPPGTVTAESVRSGIAGGFRPVLLVQVGSLVGDATWAIIALAGAAVLVQNPVVRFVLGCVGVVFLLYLAWGALQAARDGALPKVAPSQHGYFTRGALLALTNPFAVAYWLGVGSAMTAVGVVAPQPWHFVLFFGGFMTGAVLWALFISSIIAWGRRFVHARFFRWINLVSAAALAYFGLSLCWSLFNTAP